MMYVVCWHVSRIHWGHILTMVATRMAISTAANLSQSFLDFFSLCTSNFSLEPNSAIALASRLTTYAGCKRNVYPWLAQEYRRMTEWPAGRARG